MMVIKEDLIMWFINFLIKNSQAVVVIQTLSITNNQLKNYINQLLGNVKQRAVYSRFKDNIRGADLADMQLISKLNKGFKFLLRVINFFSNYAQVIPLKDSKGVSIAFQKNIR